MKQSNRPMTLTVQKTWTIERKSLLLEFLFEKLSDWSKSKVKSALSHQLIRVNGSPVSQFNFELRPGMKVELLRGSNQAMRPNPYVSIHYEDQWLLVINKQPGILSMQSDHHSFCVKTLLDDYLKRSRQACTAHVVHRLDRETSGLMVFAKSTKVQQIFTNHWHELVTDRRYLALVSGMMTEEKGTVSSWLKDDKFYFTYSSPTDNGGKYAVTHFRTLQKSERYSLVELQLETGRKNQIRVHLQDIGHPVVGDYKYGVEGDDPIGRLGLHAFRLNFTHPITGKPMNFETGYPTTFLEVLSTDV